MASWRSHRPSEGSPKHIEARERVKKILEARGLSLEKEVTFDNCTTERGWPYTADLVATLKVVVEIDGKSHWSKTAINKDEVRTESFEKQVKIPTVRFSVFDIIGKKSQDDETIISEFLHQLNHSKVFSN